MGILVVKCGRVFRVASWSRQEYFVSQCWVRDLMSALGGCQLFCVFGEWEGDEEGGEEYIGVPYFHPAPSI